MRLFLAIELNDQVKQAMAAARQRLGEFDRAVRWTKPDQMHLTLKFLGECDDNQMSEVDAACLRVARMGQPFEMTLAGGGCFPSQGQVRVIWVGLDEPHGALVACGQNCEATFSEIGFASERRPFSPHVTLGRVRDDRTQGCLRTVMASIKMRHERQRVKEFVLIRSELSPSGMRYTVAGRYRLGSDG